MSTIVNTFKARSMGLLVLISLLVLAGCGSSTSTSGGSTGGTPSNSSIHLTIGGKLDTEAQLLTSLYSQVLEHAGFKVTEKAKLGTNDIVFNAITSGSIDLYPEYTGTALLTQLKLPSISDGKRIYATVKEAYHRQYGLTWLDPPP